jgi:hypothetical protein
MDYNALDDYLSALQQKMTDNISNDNNPKTDAQYQLYSGYSDAIDFPMRHLRYETKLTPAEAHDYSRTLCHLFAPSMIERHLPQHRQAAAYQATSQLAHAMERLAAGKRARKLFGIF